MRTFVMYECSSSDSDAPYNFPASLAFSFEKVSSLILLLPAYIFLLSWLSALFID